jgi:hypothetical protein
VTRAASRRDAHFLEGAARGRPSLSAIHHERFFEGVTEVIQQFLAGLALGVDAGDFLDPADPPFAVLLDNGGVVRCHEGPPTKDCELDPQGDSIPLRKVRRRLDN